MGCPRAPQIFPGKPQPSWGVLSMGSASQESLAVPVMEGAVLAAGGGVRTPGISAPFSARIGG